MNRTRRDIGRRLLVVVAIGVLAVAVLSGPAASHTGDDGLHHHDGWMGTHNGMGSWMVGSTGFLWMVLWVFVLIGAPVALVYRYLTRSESTDGTADDDALVLLRRRYAQGEIDEEEFETRRTKLRAE